MEEEAIKGGAPVQNPYSALGKFFRAANFYNLTMLVGDVAMDEALQGLAITTPKYNTQKEIFIQILKWLEELKCRPGFFNFKGWGKFIGR